MIEKIWFGFFIEIKVNKNRFSMCETEYEHFQAQHKGYFTPKVKLYFLFKKLQWKVVAFEKKFKSKH
jgi:hypothetical protein